MKRIREIRNFKKTKFEKFLYRLWKEFKLGIVRLVNWLFFYRAKSNMDAFLHIIAVIAWVYIGIFCISK